MKWTRLDTGSSLGYVSGDGRVVLHDNGGGLGSSKGSGRWAVEVDGKWLANVDTLVEAKTLGKEKA